jgi:hypothetical protein
VLAPEAVQLLLEQVRASAPMEALPLPVQAAVLPALALEQASASPPLQVEALRSPSRQASWQASAVPEPLPTDSKLTDANPTLHEAAGNRLRLPRTPACLSNHSSIFGPWWQLVLLGF